MKHRSLTALAVALSFTALAFSPPAAAAAGDADLAEIRKQLQQMKEAYEQRIAALEQKLAQAAGVAAKAEGTAAKAESVAREAESAARQASLRPPAAAPASGFNPEASLILQGQVRRMKDVGDRRIAGFWPTEVETRRGFSLDESELVLAANVDPYWRGQAIVALIDGEAEVEEAWFQSLGLGNGFGLKGGRLRSGIGYLNEQHPHAQDFADAPLIYQAMFGEGASYTQDGVQLKWVAPTDTFFEVGAEAGRGAAFPGSERNKNGAGGGALFAHVGDDIGVSHSWRAGLSYLQTQAKAREATFADAGGLDAATASFDGKSRTWIADFVWKWAPEGNANYRNFKLQGEYFQRRERGDLACANAVQSLGNNCDPGNTGAVVLSDYRSRQSGWYLQGVYQFTPNWRAGLRYDRLDSGRRDFGANAANVVVEDFRPKRVTLMADYSWSEFSRMRLQLAQDKSIPGVTDNRVWLQYIMSLGAHGAHKF
ncbi:MAG: TonB-dependent receptor [Rhodocyclales bacterium]|nr:TonB-dependent receptor [Rhodocyclales bacterium]